jgi:hypothetical protein
MPAGGLRGRLAAGKNAGNEGGDAGVLNRV